MEAADDVLMKRLEDGDNFNDAVETIPRRIKTYRCKKDQTKESKDGPTLIYQLFTCSQLIETAISERQRIQSLMHTLEFARR